MIADVVLHCPKCLTEELVLTMYGQTCLRCETIYEPEVRLHLVKSGAERFLAGEPVLWRRGIRPILAWYYRQGLAMTWAAAIPVIVALTVLNIMLAICVYGGRL